MPRCELLMFLCFLICYIVKMKRSSIPSNSQPKLKNLKPDLTGKIRSYLLKTSSLEPLPTMQSLGEHFHVSRQTISKALRPLIQERLIEVKPGRGIRFVKLPSSSNHLQELPTAQTINKVRKSLFNQRPLRIPLTSKDSGQ